MYASEILESEILMNGLTGIESSDEIQDDIFSLQIWKLALNEKY